MSAEAPTQADRLAWLSEHYPLPPGWRWWQGESTGPYVASPDGLGLTREGAVFARHGAGGVLRLECVTTNPRGDVVEQVLAVARLDPAEIGQQPLRLDPPGPLFPEDGPHVRDIAPPRPSAEDWRPPTLPGFEARCERTGGQCGDGCSCPSCEAWVREGRPG